MMLLKRLLLPGKGGLIICIFIFINVLLWRAEPEKEAANYRDVLNYTVTLVITSLLYRCLLSSKSVSNASWCKYYGVAIVMFYYFSSLQFHRVYASEEVFDASKAHTPQPVFNKTDPLSMTLALNKGGGGASLIATQHNDYNYNKGRRRPVHNNSSSNSRINSKSRSGGIISSNSSNFLNNSVLDTISLSGGGSVLLEGGGGNRSIGNSNSSAVKRNNADNNDTTDSSNLKLSSDNSTLSSMKQKKGKTRKVSVHISASRNNQSRPAKVKRRKPKLLKELTMFNRQNCLAKLLCGVQVAQPPTKSSSALNDYAYLVKAFFDRFSIKGIVTDVIDTAFQYEQDAQDNLDDEIDADLRGDESEILGDDQDDDDDDSSERRKKKGPVKLGNKYIGGAALHKARRPQYNYNVKYYKEYDADLDDVDLDFLDLVDDDIPEFMQPDVLRKRQGKKFVKPFNQTERGNGTVLARRKRRSRPMEIDRVRRKRGIVGEVKRGFMGFFNPRFDKTAYLDKRQLDLTSEEDEGRQLTIAEEIVKRLRSPRQCRLLNWFGNTDSKSTQTTSANGMTTTITTITNTGGMVGNLDKLSHLQTGLPQSSINAGGSGSQGSQVVTVIQQTPVGAPTSSTPTTSSAKPIFNAKATEMLNNFGQTASSAMSSAMSQAGDVASHAGNTICPFNIQELQELILKAQTAPFPHFLTTTKAPPAQPFPAFPRETANEPPKAATSTSSTPTLGTTTTIKATQPPPPSTTTINVQLAPGRGRGQTRNGLDSSFAQLYGDFSPQGHPSPPRYPYSSQNSDAEDDDDDDSETPYYQQPTSPAPPHYHNHHKPPQRTPPNFYTTLTPIFPSPMYPSPTHPSEYQADQQTRQPDIIPSIGVSEGYQDNFFDDGSYEKNKVPSPYERHKVHHHPGLRRKKPTPKWMTTTPVPEDELYDYNNNAVPNPSFGFGTPHFGHKPQRQQGYKDPISKLYHQEKQGSYNKRPVRRPQNSMGYNRPMHHPNKFKVRPDLPKEPDPTPNYIREFHQPPVVVDSNNRIVRYPNAGYRQTSPQSNPNAPVRGQNQNSGQNKKPQQQRNKPQNNEDSDEDDSESSDDDSDESSSSSAEARAALPPPPPPELPPDLSGRPPTGPAPPPLPPPTEGSLEASEEDDDTSNEAQERKEKGAENNEEDEEESDEEEDGDDENDGKRSYERNDFSKDRGGPPSESTTTENPNSKKVEYAGSGSSSNGFISNFFNSINPFSSFFKRDSEKSKRENMIRNSNKYNHANPLPPTKQRPHSVNVPSKLNSNEESDEPENDDDDESDDEENSEEDASKAVIPKPPKRKPVHPPPKQKIIQKPKRKINLQMNTKIPIDPWVHGDTQLQISLKTTPVPVVIESSSSWARPFWDREEDDSGEEDLRENPVSEAVKNKKKDSVVTLPEKKHNLDFFTGLGLSPGLSEFLNDLSLTNTKKKESKDTKEAQKKVVKKPATAKPLKQDDDDDEEDDESNESDEDNGPPRRPPPFMPPEPID